LLAVGVGDERHRQIARRRARVIVNRQYGGGGPSPFVIFPPEEL